MSRGAIEEEFDRAQRDNAVLEIQTTTKTTRSLPRKRDRMGLHAISLENGMMLQPTWPDLVRVTKVEDAGTPEDEEVMAAIRTLIRIVALGKGTLGLAKVAPEVPMSVKQRLAAVLR